MNQRRHAPRAISISLWALTLSAAATAGRAAESGPPARARPPEPGANIDNVKLLVGHLPVTGHAKLFIAKEEGFFADEGLDVELIPYLNSSDGLAALYVGKLDVGIFGTVAPLVYIASGRDIRILGGIMGEDAYIVARPETAGELREIADLRGRRVATVGLSSGDAVLRGALERAGLSWKEDLSLAVLSNPDSVLLAVRTGQADAGVVWGPYDQLAVAKGLRVVFATADIFPGHPCCRVVVTAKRYQEKFVHWPGFMRAILRAERFSHDPANRERTIDHIDRYLDLDREVIEKGFFKARLDQASDPNAVAVGHFWNIMNAAGMIHNGAGPDLFIERAPYREALDSLRRAEPDDLYWQRLDAAYDARNIQPPKDVPAPADQPPENPEIRREI